MSAFQPANPDFRRMVSESFGRQGMMATLGARLGSVEPGQVEILLPFSPGLSQQHGFFHAGATSAIADSAGGYAAYSLFPAGSSVLTVEYKINLLAPAEGERLRAVGHVVKPGRTITVTEVEVFVLKDGSERLCGKMQQTMMRLDGRADGPPPAAERDETRGRK